jgi:hypothetical protein
VEPHPIRVVVTDDRRRSRLTVFFRLLLAIPHFIWLLLWTIAAFFAAIANWAATLVRGEPPLALHRFLAAYVRYSTHVWAYVYLAANPFPAFDGAPGYPVDVEIPGPVPQPRGRVALRLLLALPTLLLAAAFLGNGGAGGGRRRGRATSGGISASGVATSVAVLGWFACLVRGEMPRGFRDLQAYLLRYGAQAWGYLFLLTDRYPTADPAEPRGPEEPPAHPVTATVDDDGRRSRLTTFFRLLLSVPHFIWAALWTIAALFAAVAGWFAALVTGRLPSGLHRFLAAYVRYTTHLRAYVYLVANPFPGFAGAPGYPLDVTLPEPQPQGRWTVAFRIVLAIPALIVTSALGGPLLVAGFYGWVVSLVTGRMPTGLRNFGAYAIRYSAQAGAYLLLVTGRYPDSGPRQRAPEEHPAAPAEPSFDA